MSDLLEQLELRPEVVSSALSTSPAGKIIVVDDEPELRNILVKALSSHGFEVTGCSGGHQALEELREKEFDLLLTDLMMPEMDGITLLEAALKVDPNLIGVMMTGQGTIQTAVDAMKVGAFDYVLKPFRLQTVMPILTRAVSTRRLRMENLQLRETVAIYSLCQTIAFTLDTQTVLSRLADAALQQSDADEVSILLPTSDETQLYVAAVRGNMRERLLGERIPLQESISSWVARERTPLILNGEVQDERFVALWPRPEIHSAVSVPMQVANKLVGVINLNVTSRLRPFTSGQMKALSILASTAAAALESASLYAQVQRAEKNYRSIFENAVEGVFQSTTEGTFITVNPSMARILGYESPDDVIGTSKDIASQIYVHPESRTEAAQIQEERGLLQGFEFEAYRKDGEKIWLSMNRRSVWDESGTEIYREGTLEEITERKRAEETQVQLNAEIREQRHRLNTIVANVPGIVFEAWGRPDALDIRSEFVSEYIEPMLGYTVKEWLSKPGFWLSIVHPEDRDRVAREAAAHYARGGEAELEFRWVGKDKRIVWVRAFSVVVADDEGEPLGIRGVVTDITERRRTEVALRESEARKRAILESSLDCIVTMDHAGLVLDWNPAAERTFGYMREHAIGKEMADLIIPSKYRERHRRGLARYVATGHSTVLGNRLELSALRSDGAEFPVELTITRIQSEGAPMFTGYIRDITERKQAEEQLRRQLDFTEAITTSLGEGLYALDEAGRVTFMNPAAETTLGWTEAELLGKNLHEAIHFQKADGTHNPPNECSLVGVLKARHTVKIESDTFTRKDGSMLSVSYTSSPISTGDKVAGAVLAFHDTTERQRADLALRESEERYRDLVENAHDIIYEHDLQGNYTSTNKAGEQVTGYSLEETLKLNLKRTVAPEYLKKAQQMLRRKLAGEKVTAYELEIIAKDGHRVMVEVDTRLVTRDGIPVGVQGIAREITERKRGEARQIRRASQLALRGDVNSALAAINTPLRNILERCAEAIVQHLDAAFARIWTISKEGDVLELQASAGMYTHIDGPHARVPVGAFKIGLIAAERQPHISNEVQTDPRVSDLEWAKREGMIAFAGYPLIVEDRLVGVVAMFSRQTLANDTLDALASVADIISQGIERKRAEEALHVSEEQLRQSQKLEAVGQLAGGIAHDFNNLLTVISGYSDLLLRGLKQGDSTRLKIEEIRKAGERAASLTRQLLAFSRKQVLQPKVLKLNSIVADVETMLRRLIGEDIDLLTVLETSLGEIRADRGQIEQVILNLAVNARDAMPRGGKLTIETSNVYLDNEYARKHTDIRPGNYVMLAVSDSGTGMPAETQAHIFEPFFTTKAQGKGTGLGLSTVYGIVRQSEGNIWVYSEIGKGTTFKVYLPRIGEATQIDAVPEPLPDIPQGRETVLLTEDEEPVRRLTRVILEMNGYQVLEAASGDEALSIYKEYKGRVDLIITDVVMPKMSGRELAQSLETLSPGLKVLYLSGYTDDAIVRHGLLDRKLAFLQKPFTPDSLLRKMREVLDANNGSE